MSARTHETTSTPRTAAAGSWAGRPRTARAVPSARAARVRRLLQDRELLTALRDPRGWPLRFATWMTEREPRSASPSAP
jgi:hypothetical protein